MSIYKYIIRSLLFYWKQNLAVFFAILLSSAILSGALIVGDSVEMSLRKIATMRLGKVSYALLSGERFVRSELATALEAEIKSTCSPILLLEGISINTSENKRVNKTSVLGVDSSFWKLSAVKPFFISENEVIISQNLAERLKLKLGDDLLLRMTNALVIPIDAPFASTNESETVLSLKIKYIANNDQLARFSLKNDQKAPFNVFIDRDFIAKNLKISNLSNAILISETEKSIEELNVILQKKWTLADAGLFFRDLPKFSGYELISNRIFIDNVVSQKLEELDIQCTQNLTYLVNSLYFNDKSTPYSFVVASNAFGDLDTSEIIVNDWIAEDLGLEVGDSIGLNYFIINPLKKIQAAKKLFSVKAIISTDNYLIDSLLMPNFSGMTDSENCRDWEAGIPIDLTKIRDKDEAYWKKFRGKPKAVISLQSGINLWSNPFGNFTSLRFKQAAVSKSELENKLLKTLYFKDFNIQFFPVSFNGQKSVDNAVDFGELFLSLSFFVIAGALLLLFIILKLNTDSRSHEVGILSALGFSKSKILKIYLWEALVIAFFASILGSFGGIYYNKLLLIGINSVWFDIVRTDMLEMYILPKTLIISLVLNFFIALVVIYWVISLKLKTSVVRQIAALDSISKTGNYFWVKVFFSISFISSIYLLVYIFATSFELNAGLLMLASGIILISFVLAFYILLLFVSKKRDITSLSFTNLILLNLASNKARSLSVVVLLALGAFTILVTASNRKTFFDSDTKNASGTGGFLFWAENTLALEHDLNTFIGKNAYNLNNLTKYDTDFLQFTLLDGDDASCLNLNQVSKPAILGVDARKLASRSSFSFSQSILGENISWLVLDKEMGKNIIPAIADQTVITWGLMKSVGDTLAYLNEAGQELKLVLVASLNSSVFQGHILISDSLFAKNFPASGGSKVMLIDGNEVKKNQIAEELNSALVDYGIELEPTNQRLAEFNSVTNTYLSVFMILGSLGVLIATIGMGIVLLRSVFQRKSELALLLAIGFSQQKVFRLIVLENLILLFVGLFIGLISAFVGALPSLLSDSFSASWLFVGAIILLVFFNGWLWIHLAAKFTIKNNLVKSLRQE